MKILLKLFPHQTILIISSCHIKRNMFMLRKGILIIIIPKNVLIIGTALTEVIRMDHDPDLGRPCMFHDRLSDPCRPVYDHNILFCQLQALYHISHQFLFGTDQAIRKLIHHHIVVRDLLIGHRAILVEKSALIQMCLIVQRRIIFRIDPAIGKVILSDQTSVGDHLHPVDQITCLIHHIDRIKIIASGEYIFCGLAIPGKCIIPVTEGALQLFQCIRNRCDLTVCKERV